MGKWKITLTDKTGRQMSVTTDDPDEIHRLETKPFTSRSITHAESVPADEDDE